jgi:hypothetical protein
VFRRREFLYVIGAALSLPIAANAQQKVRRIGVLLPFDDEHDPQVIQLWPAFTQRMRELGWSEGRWSRHSFRSSQLALATAEDSAPEAQLIDTRPPWRLAGQLIADRYRIHMHFRDGSGSNGAP